MTRILVTGSTDGLGRAAAEALLSQGHDVVVHARNAERAGAVQQLVERGADVVVGDLAERDDVHRLGAELNDMAPLDAVIHNAGVWSGSAVMPVNIVAPYLLTALLAGPRRLVYLSSGLHRSGTPSLDGIDWAGHRAGSYADSKLFVTTLAVAVARLYPAVLSNAVDPGWVPTRMGGPGATDDLELGHVTQVWLATDDGTAPDTTGGYWYHQEQHTPHPAVRDPVFQDALLQTLADETGVTFGDEGVARSTR